MGVVNGWLLYRKEHGQHNIPGKPLTLVQFISQIQSALIQSERRRGPGRSSLNSLSDQSSSSNSSVVMREPLPLDDVRYDEISHLPIWVEKRGRCKECNERNAGYTFGKCSKCNVYLCLKAQKYCFYNFHNTVKK